MGSVVRDGDDTQTPELHVTNNVFCCWELSYIGSLKLPGLKRLLWSPQSPAPDCWDLCSPEWNWIGEGPCLSTQGQTYEFFSYLSVWTSLCSNICPLMFWRSTQAEIPDFLSYLFQHLVSIASKKALPWIYMKFHVFLSVATAIGFVIRYCWEEEHLHSLLQAGIASFSLFSSYERCSIP